MATAPEPQPTAEVVRRLVADVVRLLQAYRDALGAQARATRRDIAMASLMTGAALALAALVPALAVAALILVLTLWLPAWLAVLGVLVLVLATSAGLVALSLRRLRRRRAAWSSQVGEEVRWLRNLFHRES
ncbi:MAG: phage holin family protein [Armatimonadota bacterium]|nr:phage holin family protein [Armatimonadota bacterium]MDR7533980.1 phage holin family protein [Armatimonadota bacterium]MDR7536448.1 phage holin family protein [Armatimonadota bacterium]